MKLISGLTAVGAALFIAGCQSATVGDSATVGASKSTTVSGSAAEIASVAPTVQASAPAAFAAKPAAASVCTNPLAGGPPPAPDKGSDFAKNAIGKNLARNVGRNLLGSVVGGGAARCCCRPKLLRTEQDVGGKWQVTDGSPNCGCEIQVRTGSGFTRVGVIRDNYTIKPANTGSMTALGCTNSQLAAVARFGLGHSFTGYGAELEIKEAGGATVAKLTRNGINHFSGALADGTPVTLWRRAG
ncbi:MAG: hypothetical protein U5K75_09045 [Ahrensia sp.]|nr:hypothetical protein [Ahrensia sp.]